LGSILLLAALGLAITYGVIGIINMAHGELLMIGAFATFVVHDIFRDHYTEYFDWYIVVAVPVAFFHYGHSWSHYGTYGYSLDVWSTA